MIMLPDYEIKRKTSIIEKIMPYIEFVLILIILQVIILLFWVGPSEEETIRFRLLANSNTPADQEMKKEIQREIEPLINNAVTSAQSVEELGDNLAALEGTITKVATSLSNGVPIKLERTQALFPAKRSGFMIHPQAVYDAYIVTIGSGRGDNWWCALFPKVCFPEEQQAEVEVEVEVEDEEVTFFVWEWIKGLFSESY